MADVEIRIHGRDESRGAFRSVQTNATSLRSKLVALGTLANPIGASMVAAMAPAVSALAGASVAVGAFGLAVAGQVGDVTGASKAMDAYNNAVRDFGEGSQQAQTALQKYQTQMKSMTPATRATAKEFIGLKSTFSDWSRSLSSSTMPGFTKGLSVLRTIIPTLTPIVKHVGEAFNSWMTTLKQKVESPGFDAFMAKVSQWAITGFDKLVKGITDVAKAIGQKTGSGGFKGFIDYLKNNGQKIMDILTNLGPLIKTVAESMGKGSANAGSDTVSLINMLSKAIALLPKDFIKALGPLIEKIAYAYALWTVAMQAHAAAVAIYAGVVKAVEIATKAWSIAQAVFNAVMAMNPIMLIVIAIIALVAIIVLVATKTTWFQDIWGAVWGFIKDKWEFVWGVLKGGFNALKTFFTQTLPNALNWLKGRFGAAWDWIKQKTSALKDWVKSKFQAIIDFIKSLPGKIRSAAKGLWDGVKNAARDAFNAVAGFWNRTIGSISFSVPGWVPGVGGKSFSVPDIGYAATGGIRSGLTMVGERGAELVDLPPGSHVRNANQTASIMRQSGGATQVTLVLEAGDSDAARLLVSLLRPHIRNNHGGNVQLALGGSR